MASPCRVWPGRAIRRLRSLKTGARMKLHYSQIFIEAYKIVQDESHTETTNLYAL
jgi:hypothetical protein